MRVNSAHTTTTTTMTTMTTFADLQLDDMLVRAMRESGHASPSPVQMNVIPLGRFGCDVIAQAKSGTGKTLTFVVVALERVEATRRRTQVLVLAPTRECAMQTHDCFVEVISKLEDGRRDVKTAVVVGGLSVKEDRARLATHPHVVVGTPGRTRQMLDEGAMACDGVRLLILDEADALLSGTFERDVLFAYSMLPERKQVCAFSATYSKELIDGLERLMRAPQKVMLCESTTALRGVRQFYSLIEENTQSSRADVISAKEARLLKICSDISFHQAIIFVRRTAWGEALAKRLSSHGLKAAFTAGSLPQERRMQVMEQMRNFQLRILVSTDLTARGVDLTHVNLVINLDLPQDGATYMHRIGRTGRFGTYGIAVAVLTFDELESLRAGLESERGGDIEPLPEVIPPSWYDYELDNDDATLFQALKHAPIDDVDDHTESEGSDVNDIIDQTNAAEEPRGVLDAVAAPQLRTHTVPTHHTNTTDTHTTTGTTNVHADARTAYDHYWAWFHRRHPAAARPPRAVPPPPGAPNPWIIPPLHADFRRLPFLS
jgi:ATP-dependent RNA helicase DDX20